MGQVGGEAQRSDGEKGAAVELQKKSDSASKHIEERLLSAYHRIRSNARNGLAVVAVEREHLID